MPTFALNFYNPAVADQLRTGRKTATIRLGDKSAKYRKGMIVTVLCGARYGQRERIFDAVIDKVEVKALARAVTARDRARQPADPSGRRDGLVPRAALQPRGRRGRDRDADPLLADHCSDVRSRRFALADRCDSTAPVLRIAVPKSSRSRTGAPHSSHSTANADAIGAAQLGQRCRSSPPHCGHAPGARPRRRGSSGACARRRGRTRPSRPASCAAPPGSSCASALAIRGHCRPARGNGRSR